MTGHALSSYRPILERILPIWPWIVVLSSAVALAAALVSQYGFGLHPCALCLYQRWPYGIAIALCLVAATRPPAGRARMGLLAASAVVLWLGTLVAAYHVGVEQGWWLDTLACGGVAIPDGDPQAVLDQLLAREVVSCDVVTFSVFGVSMAGYNVLASMILGAATLWAAVAGRRYATGTRENG